MTPHASCLDSIRAALRGEAPHAPTLTVDEVCALTGETPQSLRDCRGTGAGPVGLRVDGQWMYFADEVAEWARTLAPIAWERLHAEHERTRAAAPDQRP